MRATMAGLAALPEQLASGALTVEGDMGAVGAVFVALEQPDFGFATGMP